MRFHELRVFSIAVLSAALLLTGCEAGPEETPDAVLEEEVPTEEELELTMPAWYELDEANERVVLELVAGTTSANNYWNFHGMYGGEGLVRVPVGYEVELVLVNEDPNMAHSVGVGERQDSYPASFSEAAAEPVFAGAVTPNPTSLTDSTLPGETDVVTFVADRVGEYDLICYVPGHAQQGMILPFEVADDGEYGVVM